MNKGIIPVAASLMMFAACNNENKEASEKANATAAAEAAKSTPSGSASSSSPDIPSATMMCFAKMEKKDTVVLSFTRTGNEIAGKLLYQFNEKDKNSGTITGTVSGDTILAVYTFMSEGVSSQREAIFLKQGDEVVEGFGFVEDKNGKMVYKDRSKLTFEKDVVLKKIDCGKLQ